MLREDGLWSEILRGHIFPYCPSTQSRPHDWSPPPWGTGSRQGAPSGAPGSTEGFCSDFPLPPCRPHTCLLLPVWGLLRPGILASRDQSPGQSTQPWGARGSSLPGPTSEVPLHSPWLSLVSRTICWAFSGSRSPLLGDPPTSCPQCGWSTPGSTLQSHHCAVKTPCGSAP